MKLTIFGEKISVMSIVILFALGMLVCYYTICSCSGKEGFTAVSPDIFNKSWEVLGDKENTLLNLLNTSKFSPECCPSTYSNSSGCLCDTNEFQFMNKRGGNRACCSET